METRSVDTQSETNARLSREIVSQVQAALPAATVSVFRVRDWSSALFSGVRISAAIEHAESDDFSEQLANFTGEWEPKFTDHFCASADLVVRSHGHAEIEFLLVEES